MDREDIAGWMRELAGWFEALAKQSNMTCTNELNMKRAEMWRERAAQVESMRCETCKWWEEKWGEKWIKPGETKWSCKRMYHRNKETYNREGEVTWCGPDFCCCHWEGKE